MIHTLKTWPQPLEAVRAGKKTFEVRKNDRNYKVGDFLILMEWNPEELCFTGNEVDVIVTYILKADDIPNEYGFGLTPGTVIMGIKLSYEE